jgi:hypothetical protein
MITAQKEALYGHLASSIQCPRILARNSYIVNIEDGRKNNLETSSQMGCVRLQV